MVVKQVGTKAVDLTRSVLVEMKQVSEKQVLINRDRSFFIHQGQFIFFYLDHRCLIFDMTTLHTLSELPLTLRTFVLCQHFILVEAFK